jgi:hypothetical protein
MNDRNVRSSHQDVIREAEGLHVLEMDREAAALLRTVPEDSEDYVGPVRKDGILKSFRKSSEKHHNI